MDERIKKLKSFVNKYGDEYTKDGTKTEIEVALENGDDALALQILDAMDKRWIERTMKLGRFVTFTDIKYPGPTEKPKTEYYSVSYIDDFSTGEREIPVLRHVIVRERERDIVPKKYQEDR